MVMLNNIITVPAKDDSPFIQMDTEKSLFVIKGKSFPSNPVLTYSLIKSMINKAIDKEGSIYLELELIYMNTASKLIINEIIEKIHNNLQDYEIVWLYSDEDLLDEITYIEWCTEAKIKKIYRALKEKD